MAEGWLWHLAGDRFEVFTAGIHPVGLNLGSVEAMSEVGIDISRHRSKPAAEFMWQRFDHVITVCNRARESCPMWPGPAHLLHWSFDDPDAATDSEEERRHLFRRARDEISFRIKASSSRTRSPRLHESPRCPPRPASLVSSVHSEPRSLSGGMTQAVRRVTPVVDREEQTIQVAGELSFLHHYRSP